MRPQTPQHAVKFIKSPEVLAYERREASQTPDSRQRDQRPGRFTVRGAFLDLAGSLETTEEAGSSHTAPTAR
jgi:hypothetical protein